MIVTEKMNRAVASITGAIIAFIFLLLFPFDPLNSITSVGFSDLFEIENLIVLSLQLPPDQHIFLFLYEHKFLSPFSVSKVLGFMFGTIDDNFSNFHSLILIFGIMIQVTISQDAGVFQFLALKLIKGAKGDPKMLLFYCCILAVSISAILSNILAIIILIPLTIMICRMLNINPIPYILSEAILVNVGGMMFLISSVPNILISQAAGLNFLDYLFNLAWFAIILLTVSYFVFRMYFKNRLKMPETRLIRVIEDFNPWNFVPNKQLFYKSIACLISTFVLIVAIPNYPDTVAIFISFILIIISNLDFKKIVSQIDFELMLYLIGIFILTGCLEYVGVMSSIGFALKDITGGNPFITVQIILWLSSFLSSGVDNIPITTALLPTMPILTLGFNTTETQMSYFALGLGCNLGESLAPIGGNLLVINIAEQNDTQIKFKEFLKIGLISALIQISLVSLYLGIRLAII
ncbi:MAG: SLC13 family permease [Candidatus Helarchaeota archaeon]